MSISIYRRAEGMQGFSFIVVFACSIAAIYLLRFPVEYELLPVAVALGWTQVGGL